MNSQDGGAAGVGYTPAPIWLSQGVMGDPGFVSWSDSLFNNTGGIPPNFGMGGFAPGLQFLGTLTFFVGSIGLAGDPILTIRNGSASFVDLDTIPETVILSRALDNCPFVSNPDQAPSSQYPLVGCACLCGDGNRNCVINSQDGSEASRRGIGLPPQFPATWDDDFCDFNGNTACNSQDGIEMSRVGIGLPPQFPVDPTGCVGYQGP